MRKLGLIGGMSWVSTRTYYEHINRLVQERRAKHASAPLLIESLDFMRLWGLSNDDDWDRAATVLIDSAQRLEQAGAGAILIGANSMHKVYDRVAEAVDVPIIHIADCVGEKMKADGIQLAALIGTRNVMTESFYRQRLISHGIKLLPPEIDAVDMLDRIIYDELMNGRATRDAERSMKSLFTDLEKKDAKAIILACTELEMVVDIDANVLPIYDCTRIHAARGAEWILAED